MTLAPTFILLQVVPDLDTGGAEQTTLDVARAVVQAGGRALVATRGGRMTDRLKADGGEVILLPMSSKNPLVMLANALALIRIIRQCGVQVIHARSRAPAFSALWAARATGIPFIATYHGVYKARSALKRWYNAVMTRGDLVIANSDYTRDHVLAEHGLDPEHVVTIPRGVDLARFDPAKVTKARLGRLRALWGLDATEARPVFLLAGRLTRIKGHLTIIDAVARLKARGRDVLVLFAGDDQGRSAYRQEVQTAIETAGLSQHIRRVGHCDDMPAACLLADVALLPTLVPESFGRAAVEPQVMGRPVIASAHGGTTETVVDGQTGWLVAPGDADAWAQAMDHAASLGRRRLRAMGKRGSERARRLYSNETMCAATLEVYSRLLAGGHKRR